MEPISKIVLGSALFSIVEPHPGHAREYNHWYERDHFYAGCMVGPNFFAGRRWVATKAMKALRVPRDNPVLPSDMGSFLVLYWMLAGHYDETVSWAVDQVNQLHRQERMFAERDSLSTGFYHHRFTVSRDPDGVPVELALDHPFLGVVAIMVDRKPGMAPGAFETAVRDEVLPALLADSPVALVAYMTPAPLPDAAPSNVSRSNQGEQSTRYLWLAFLDRDPESCCAELLPAMEKRVNASGYGRLVIAAPFIPTIPGTDAYMDTL